MMRTAAGVSFTLTRKNVKNINLRVTERGVFVSAGRHVPLAAVDGFVAQKADWIHKALQRIAARIKNINAEAAPPACQCEAIFAPFVARVWELFHDRMEQKPKIKVKPIKSAWGICHFKDGYITLAARLANMPPAAIEYVVLHEFVHFFEPNHGAGFHKMMAQFMPDYQARRKLLK